MMVTKMNLPILIRNCKLRFCSIYSRFCLRFNSLAFKSAVSSSNISPVLCSNRSDLAYLVYPTVSF